MTKAEIVAEIAQKTGIEKVAIQATVEEFMTVIKESLSEAENVYLRGFDRFIVKKRAEKTGRNISRNTTEAIRRLSIFGVSVSLISSGSFAVFFAPLTDAS